MPIISPTAHPSLAQIYAETLETFQEGFRLYLTNAPTMSGQTRKKGQEHSLAALYCLADIFELLIALRETQSDEEPLVYPFSTEGMEFYRTHYQLSNEQWRGVSDIFAEMSSFIGEDLLTHLQSTSKFRPKRNSLLKSTPLMKTDGQHKAAARLYATPPPHVSINQ